MKTAGERALEAIDEAREQLANGWTPTEVLVVLVDAATVIDDLRAQEAGAT